MTEKTKIVQLFWQIFLKNLTAYIYDLIKCQADYVWIWNVFIANFMLDHKKLKWGLCSVANYIFYMMFRKGRYLVHLLFNTDICNLFFIDVSCDTSHYANITTSYECCQYYYKLMDKLNVNPREDLTSLSTIMISKYYFFLLPLLICYLKHQWFCY